MSERIYILGNGFNKDLNLNVDYENFFKSPYWREITKYHKSIPLIDYISKKENEGNYNIEELLANYLKQLNESSDSDVESDKEGLDLIESKFSEFVTSQTNYDKGSKAYKLLIRITKERNKMPQNVAIYIYSFCYTLFDEFRKQNNQSLSTSICNAMSGIFSGNPLGGVNIDIDYIHGRSSNGKSNAIFGVSCDAFKGISPCIQNAYDFFLKEKHVNYMPCKKKYLQDSLMRADYIHFFGFSFSNPDIPYVEHWLTTIPGFLGVRRIVLDVFDKHDGDSIINKMMQIAGPNWVNITSKYSIVVRDLQCNEYSYLQDKSTSSWMLI